MNTDPRQSAQPCGCDPGHNYHCVSHRDEMAIKMNAILFNDQKDDKLKQPIEVPLRIAYPHGHPRFLPLTLKEMELHSLKNHDYAKGGSPLGNFERVSQILALYPNLKLSDQRVVALVYAMKQLDAVLWGMSQGIEHKVEGANSRLQDISVYAKIVMCMNEDLGQEGK